MPFTKVMAEKIRQLTNEFPVLRPIVGTRPALAAALASGEIPADQFDRAVAIIASTGDLQAACLAIGLPSWVHGFHDSALVANFAGLPHSAAFAGAIAPLLPKAVSHQRDLMATLRVAYHYADEAFALWAAHQQLKAGYSLSADQLAIFGAFATVTRDPALPARSLALHPWSPDLSVPVTARYALGWLAWVHYETTYGTAGQPCEWGDGVTVKDVTLERLRSAQEFIAAARLFRNCVYYYGPNLLRDTCRIYRVVRDGQAIGLAELRPSGLNDRHVGIHQIKGFGRNDLGREYDRVVHAMLAVAAPTSGRVRAVQGDVLTQRWRTVFGSFLNGREFDPVFPSSVTQPLLDRLFKSAMTLRQLGELEQVLLGDDTDC
jgi:hypothetical protein